MAYDMDAPGESNVSQPSERLPQGHALFEKTRAEVLRRSTTPLSTYRLQFHAGFRFTDASALADYLAKLGVSHVYASPYLRAMPGSNHGYDVVDHQSINPEVGTPEDHAAFCAALKSHGLGQILDVVPNHMGIGKENALWFDVLENGPSSLYAKYFDIDWHPLKEELQHKVHLPILGEQYGVVLENGELRLSFSDGSFFVHYHDHLFPVAPRQYATLLEWKLEALEKVLGTQSAPFVELLSILTSVKNLPEPKSSERAKVLERNREKEVIKRRIAALASSVPQFQAHVASALEHFNGTPGDPRSFDDLDRILARCPYRLAHWKVAGEEINYRRFFDINSLAAIRVEDPEVFEEAHALVFHWLGEGLLDGLRIDHPDGLFEPTAYFLDLQERAFVERARALQRSEGAELSASAEQQLRVMFREEVVAHPDSPLRKNLYVVVEKIQGGKERIPESWAVHGTVGYRFANGVTGLFVDRASERAMTETYERFIGQTVDYRELLYQKKRLVLDVSLSSEVNVLARELNRISEMNRRSRDFTLSSLRRILIEFIALFPVYRTYVDGARDVDERDSQYIQWTIEQAKQKSPTQNVTIYDFLRDILLCRFPSQATEDERRVMLRFAMKVQQMTGPVMAKGLEDTVFYLYNRLVALNEVGGEPERYGFPLDAFHLRNQERAERWPASMLASSTHDTKRSEDVRARLCVLSELPDEWRTQVRRWARLNQKHKTRLDHRWAPDANEEYLLYQTLLGAWPMGERPSDLEWEQFALRLRAYLQKAIKEAKHNTSWTNPDAAYEAAVDSFVERVLSRKLSGKFLEEAFAFKQRLERPGQMNSITGAVLKLTCPGMPDLYQGSELWDLSLVDPDNRRPVDFAERRHKLEALDTGAQNDRPGLCRDLFASMDDGRIKLFVLAQGLRLRGQYPELFLRGNYRPVDVKGPHAQHLIAFSRQHQTQSLLVVVPRWMARCQESPGGLQTCFEDAALYLPDSWAGKVFLDAFTGRQHPVLPRGNAARLELGEDFHAFPWLLLVAA